MNLRVGVGVYEAKVRGRVMAAATSAVSTVFGPSMLKIGIGADQMGYLYIRNLETQRAVSW